MGRKKKSVVRSANLVDDVDGIQKNSKEDKCNHAQKATNPTCVQKKLQSVERGKLCCGPCKKNTADAPTSGEEWVCLRCGYLFCKQHSVIHYNTPRSDLHVLFYCIQDRIILCLKCNHEVSVRSCGGLKSAVASIETRMEREVATVAAAVSESPASPLVPSLPNQSGGEEGGPPPLVGPAVLVGAPLLSALPLPSPPVHDPPHRRRFLPATPPAVKGLSNLGNTCFFNSVLQCLARTPGLVNSLHVLDREEQHISLTLSNGHKLEGRLERSSDALGSCLSETLEALCTPGGGAYTPSKLLSFLRKKCPQFEGYEQHDAHELLRHLLDNVRLSDHKRYRSLVLKEMGLSWKVGRADISEEVRNKLKTLDHEVTEKVTLVPDDVFKGQLVSTLECQDCHHISTRVESFMDLSLPVVAESETMLMKRKLSSSPELVDEKAGQVSKHQLKKEKKQANSLRRRVRKSYTSTASAAPDRAQSPSSPQANNSSDRGESDADVEDNEEVEKRHESGYSSEKGPSESGESEEVSGACGEDSARTSPTADGALCEGYPMVGEWCGGSAGWTGEGAWRGSCGRGVRMSSSVGDPLSSDPRKWLSDSGTAPPLLIPDPADVMGSWQGELPRAGRPPAPGPALPLGSISEEDPSSSTAAERTQPREECTLNKLSIVHKLADDILSRVTLFQKEGQGGSCCGDGISNGWDNSLSPSQSSVPRGGCQCEGEQVVPKLSEADSLSASPNGGALTNPEDSWNQEEATVSPINSVGRRTSISPNPSSPNGGALGNEEDTWNQEGAMVSPISPIIGAQADSPNPEVSPDNHNGQPLSSPTVNDCQPCSPNSPQTQPFLSFFDTTLKITAEKENDEVKEEEKKDAPEEEEQKMGGGVIALGFKPSTDNSRQKGIEAEGRDPYQELKLIMDLSHKKERPQHDTQREAQDYSIHSCLNQFISVELMSGSNKVGCSACTTRANKGKKDGKTVYTIASKQFLIKEAPAVLILHLKRFQVQMYSFRKLGKHVSFPLVLDLSPFCVNDVAEKEELLYSLYGIVEHSGTLNGGHYVAYVKVDCNSGGEEGDGSSYRWYHISDSHVYQVTEQRVLATQAYLLFYKRLPPSQSP